MTNQRSGVRRLVSSAAALTVMFACSGEDGPTNPEASVASLALSDAAVELTALTETRQLTATARDRTGRVLTGVSVAWVSADPQIASVSATGLVTAVAVGQTLITASAGGNAAVTSVQVRQVVHAIQVTDTAATLTSLGATTQVTGVVRDRLGHSIPGDTVSWGTSDASVATVSSTGLIRAIANGSATVTATSATATASLQVTVRQVPDAVVVAPSTVTFTSPGQQAQLTAQVLDAGGTQVASASVTWTSADTSVASVSAVGLVTGRSAGSTSVHASSGGREKAVLVRLVPQAATLEIIGGDKQSGPPLEALPQPVRVIGRFTNGQPAAGAAVQWVVAQGGGSVVPTSSVLDADGTSSVTWYTGEAPGAQRLRAFAPHDVAIRAEATALALVQARIDIEAYNPLLRSGAKSTLSSTLYDTLGTKVSGIISWSAAGPAVGNLSQTGPASAEWVGGASGNGQIIGTWSGVADTIPVYVFAASARKWKTVSVGPNNVCAIDRDGAVWCNSAGDQNDFQEHFERKARSTTRYTTVLRKLPFDRPFEYVEVGAGSTCLLDAEGQAWCWGSNSGGQRGDGTVGTDIAYEPRAVATEARFTTLDSRGGATCGLTEPGRLLCWGYADQGQLGPVSDCGNKCAARPFEVVPDSLFRDVEVGGTSTCAVTVAGGVYCWGTGYLGQGGTQPTFSALPVRVPIERRVTDVTGEGRVWCALDENRQVWCWGTNREYDLGRNSLVWDGSPARTDWDDRFASLYTSGYTDAHTCGLSEGGAVSCWGDYPLIQGPGAAGFSGDWRARAVAVGFTFKRFATGQYRFCGITIGDDLVCWGFQERNDRLLPILQDSPVPLPVLEMPTAWPPGAL